MFLLLFHLPLFLFCNKNFCLCVTPSQTHLRTLTYSLWPTPSTTGRPAIVPSTKKASKTVNLMASPILPSGCAAVDVASCAQCFGSILKGVLGAEVARATGCVRRQGRGRQGPLAYVHALKYHVSHMLYQYLLCKTCPQPSLPTSSNPSAPRVDLDCVHSHDVAHVSTWPSRVKSIFSTPYWQKPSEEAAVELGEENYVICGSCRNADLPQQVWFGCMSLH